MPWIMPAVQAVGAIAGTVGAVSAASRGSGGSAQQAAPTNMVDPKQYAKNLNHVQGSLDQQGNLVGALQGQNALQNQSSVYNNLGQIASGQGPNPAQAMLNNTTGANAANTAAAMAGQRGAGQNAGLIARQAGQTGANLQQQAAGQGAALQAQQSLNALNQQGTMANQMAGNLMQGNKQYSDSALQGQQNLLGGQNAVNSAAVSNAQQANQTNQTIAGRDANLIGNMAGAAGTALAGPLGQTITDGLGQMFGNGQPQAPVDQSVGSNPNVLYDNNADQLNNVAYQPSGNGEMVAFAKGGSVGPRSKIGQHFAGAASPVMMARGGSVPQGKQVPALVSPGERYLPPAEVAKVVKGKKSPMKAGEKIPGKAKVKGAKNSYANDTVHKTLEEGGIVLPRSVTQAKHPHWEAHKFVSAIMAKQGKGIK